MSPPETPNAAKAVAAQDDSFGASRRVMDGLRRLVRSLTASARNAAAGRGVSGAQLFVLRQISVAPGIGLGELAERTLAGRSTVSEVVTRLVADRLVARGTRTSDARQVALRLTARGERVVADAGQTAQERLAAALCELRPADREALAHGLEAWLEAAGLGEDPAAMFFEDDARTVASPRRGAARPRRAR